MFGEVEVFKEACSIVNTPVDFYRQERDWTCSIACIRTAISYKNNRITEDEILKQENLKMGGQKIRDMKNWQCLKGLDILTYQEKKLEGIKDLYELLLDNYIVICETSYNWWHYVVAYGYLTTKDKIKIDEQLVQFYDPYYDEHKLMRAELFEQMWFDQEDKEFNRYLAVSQNYSVGVK